MGPARIVLSRHEAVTLAVILADSCEKWRAVLDQMDQGERELLATVERIRTLLPPVEGVSA